MAASSDLRASGVSSSPGAATTLPAAALAMRGIRKRFGATVALDDVDFEVGSGEIHGLVGQNGAGKSTLMKILAGDQRADQGTVTIAGEPAEIRDPRHARDLGIGIVYQELSLLTNLSVAENLALGRERSRVSFIDDRSARAEAIDALERMSIGRIDPDVAVGTLSLAEQQLVEIAKTLHQEARILVFDEPTAALALDDSRRLLATLSDLRNAGVAIIFVSHRYREVLEACDRCTVLRNGRVVTTLDAKGVSVQGLAQLTLGDHAATRRPEPRPTPSGTAPVDELKIIEVESLAVGDKVHDVSFAVAPGEVVALCGLLGSGQNEVARALYGEVSVRSGAIRLNGRPVSFRSPERAAHQGVGFLSESRRDEGIFPHLSARSNITIASLRSLWSGFPLLSGRRERALSDDICDRVGIAPEARNRSAGLLSGGNQQKALVGRWLMRGPKVLICIEPTRGVDVGARAEIYEQLRSLAATGTGLIIVTTEIDEAMTLCDRVVVIYQGRVMASLLRSETTEQEIFLAMQGLPPGQPEATAP